MHVEISEDTQNSSAVKNQKKSHPETDGAQRVSGSQVACAFTSKEREQVQLRNQGRFQVIALSMSAVSTVVAVYLVFVFAL